MLKINGGNRRFHVILLLGGPGCGKGTVSRLLSNERLIGLFSLGDLMRSERYRETKAGYLINEYMIEFEKNCKTMPIEIIRMSFELLYEGMLKQDRDWVVLDGFIKDWDMYCAWVDKVKPISGTYRFVYLEACEDTMRFRVLKRLDHGKRGDEQVLDSRLRFFFDSSVKMIEKIDEIHGVYKIDAQGSIEKVYNEFKSLALGCLTNNIQISIYRIFLQAS